MKIVFHGSYLICRDLNKTKPVLNIILCREKKWYAALLRVQEEKKIKPFFYLVLGLVVEKDVNDITTFHVWILPWTCP